MIVHFAFGGARPLVSRQVLTITDGVGTTQPSGSSTARLFSEGGATGTLSATLRLFDPSSFIASLAENSPALGCTECFEISLVRVGP